METVNSSLMNNAQAMAKEKKWQLPCMVLMNLVYSKCSGVVLFGIQSTHEVNECDSCFQIQ